MEAFFLFKRRLTLKQLDKNKCYKSCERNLTIWVTIKYVNRRRAHLFLSGLDYYKSNPPENVKASENNQYFDMTCGGFVILFGSIYVKTIPRKEYN